MVSRPPSTTALGSAYMRAAHLVHDPPPWILEDVHARKLLSDRYFNAVEASTTEWPPAVYRAFRYHFCVRARLAEDTAMERLRAGSVDYVILGAGADTFAWRQPHPELLNIWEIDHPASQAWKRNAIEAAGLATPPNLNFIGVDLEESSLADMALPTRSTWNWLGVTQYLEKAAAESTLEAIAATGSGTAVVVEFLLTEDHCDALGMVFRSRSIEIAEQAGEPMKSFYTAEEIVALLQRTGFGTIKLLDVAALAARYDIPSERLPGAAAFAIAST